MTPTTAWGFVHRYDAGDPRSPLGALTMLALHGTGGDESDLVPLARHVAPGAAILSPRGGVLERGMPRFFRRLAEGVFDERDLVDRAAALAAFVVAAAAAYRFDPARVVALGFSNGANMAATLLLLHPGVLSAAALLRPMVPLEPVSLPALAATPVLVSAGFTDPIVPRASTERLVSLLTSAGASVEVHWESGGHGLGAAEGAVLQQWLAARVLGAG